MLRQIFSGLRPTRPRFASARQGTASSRHHGQLPLCQALESRTLLAAAPTGIQPWTESAQVVHYSSYFADPECPGPGNTGPILPAVPTQIGTLQITTPNLVLQNIAVKGTLVILAPNVTIRNFTIDATGNDYGIEVANAHGGNNSVTAINGEISNARAAAIYGNNWTASRINIHDIGGDGVDGGGNNVLASCWIHLIGSNDGAHADGFQAMNGTNMVLTGNFFDLPWYQKIGNTTYSVNSCIFLNGSLYGAQYLNGTVISDNWLDGGNFEIYAMQQTGTIVTGNIFGSDSQWGDLYGDVAVWENNIG